jgi:hypothetical protein
MGKPYELMEEITNCQKAKCAAEDVVGAASEKAVKNARSLKSQIKIISQRMNNKESNLKGEQFYENCNCYRGN